MDFWRLSSGEPGLSSGEVVDDGSLLKYRKQKQEGHCSRPDHRIASVRNKAKGSSGSILVVVERYTTLRPSGSCWRFYS